MANKALGNRQPGMSAFVQTENEIEPVLSKRGCILLFEVKSRDFVAHYRELLPQDVADIRGAALLHLRHAAS